MKKEQILSVLRTIITAAGAFVAGKFIFGTAIDDQLWVGITGAILSLASVVWGVIDKTATVEMVASAARSVFLVFGPLVVSAGWIKNESVEAIALIITTLIPVLMSRTESVKNQQIAKGELPVAKLKAVDENKPHQIKPRAI